MPYQYALIFPQTLSAYKVTDCDPSLSPETKHTTLDLRTFQYFVQILVKLSQARKIKIPSLIM